MNTYSLEGTPVSTLEMKLPSIQSVIDTPCTSYWLKQAILNLFERDPIDALNDAKFLVALLKQSQD